jgi:acetate CoA/acetoacetate CoA-transferase alpha subunit
MKPLHTASKAVEPISDGATVMIGGFMCCGQPLALVDALLEKGTKGLTLICNDAGIPNTGIAKLIAAGRVKKLVASHIGLNPQAGEKMNKGEMEVLLVPQGTLVERIRAAGAGLGGVLTPTGIGTAVEQGKQKIALNGRDYLLEEALSADFALVAADVSDQFGNSFVGKARKNFNIAMSMAAKHTIVETRERRAVGQLDADAMNIPGVFVHTLVEVPS